MSYEDLVDNLMQHFTSPRYEREVQLAKEVFTKSAGIFDEESDDFEVKMSQFSDWYLFVRRLEKTDKTPVDTIWEEEEFLIPPDQEDEYKNISNSRHSLFELYKMKGNDLTLRDLFTGEKLTIKDSTVTYGIDKGQIFEARLFPKEITFVFSKSFCFHPVETNRFIWKEVKKIKKLKDAEYKEAKESLILRLFRMRYGHQFYKHLKVEDVYSNDSKLGL
jgi:hypothetical protein